MRMLNLKSYKGLERRRYPRAAGEMRIYCQSELGIKMIEGHTMDISGGGILFETDAFITPKTVLELEIYEPIARCSLRDSILTIGKSIWTRKVPNRRRYRTGIEFLEIQRRDRGRIVRYVNDRLTAE